MKVTIHDVAKLAGVSIKTVSRVTNNEPSVTQATKDKVNLAISTLNYQPNLSARNLAGRSSFVIAFVYDNPNAYYVIEMQNGILSACRENGYELLIHPCNAQSHDTFDQISSLIKRSKLSGLILTPPLSEDSNLLDKLDKLDINYVKIIAGEKNPTPDKLTVLVNDKQGALLITQHLIELGHQHIAFLNGDKQHQSSQARLQGYKQALNNANLHAIENHIIDGEYSFNSGVKNTNILLSHPIKPTAIVACNDEIAAGSLFAARIAGIDVPNELSIVGFENSPFSRQTWPKLTTVHQPTREIAQTATQMLIAHKQKKTSIKTKIFLPEVIIRNSSSPI